jgi:hypothetical protein
MTLATAAEAEQVRFLGAFTVTSETNCLARYVGELFNSAFRPAHVGSNPNFASLTMLNQYSGDVYQRAAGNFPLNTWVPVTARGFDNQFYTYPAQIKITSQSPATITAATRSVILTGVIRRMGNDVGDGGVCVAGFRGAYFRRHEY